MKGQQDGVERVARVEFPTTHWTAVLAAGREETEESARALEALCRSYWHPLYAYVRRRGHTDELAQDLTQEFFARLLATESLRGVAREKGRFRSFLLAAMDHFLAKECRYAHARKRGGGTLVLSLDDDSADSGPLQLPAPGLSPEEFFDQQWAITLLEQAIAALRREFCAAGKEATFEELKIYLTGDRRQVPYAEVAMRLGTTEAALKMAVRRLRQRYGELLRAEILRTVARPEEAEEELRALFVALSR